MVRQDNLDRDFQMDRRTSKSSNKGAEYVLDMLGELVAVAELSGHQALSDDIQDVIDKYGSS